MGLCVVAVDGGGRCMEGGAVCVSCAELSQTKRCVSFVVSRNLMRASVTEGWRCGGTFLRQIMVGMKSVSPDFRRSLIRVDLWRR